MTIDLVLIRDALVAARAAIGLGRALGFVDARDLTAKIDRALLEADDGSPDDLPLYWAGVRR